MRSFKTRANQVAKQAIDVTVLSQACSEARDRLHQEDSACGWQLVSDDHNEAYITNHDRLIVIRVIMAVYPILGMAAGQYASPTARGLVWKRCSLSVRLCRRHLTYAERAIGSSVLKRQMVAGVRATWYVVQALLHWYRFIVNQYPLAQCPA